MRDGWTETTLGDVADYINGYPFKPSDLGDEGTAVIRIKQLLDPLEKVDRTNADVPERCVLRDGDVVFSWSGTLAVRVWNRGPAYLNQHLFRVVEKSGVFHEWLPLVIEHAIEDLVEKSHGTTMKHVTKQTLLPHRVLLPPLEEQKRIVDVVSSVDVYIDALEQQADAARTARNAVLHELLSAGGDDWTEATLGPLIYLRTGKLDVNAGVDDGEFPFFTCSRDTYKIDVAAYSGKSVIVAGNGDLNVKYYEGEFNAYQRTYILQAIDESVLNPRFLFHFMDKYLETLRNDTQGSTIQYLKKAQFTEAPIALPPMDEQKRIVEIVSSMDEVIQATEQAVAEAKSLRSGLLSDLLSGEHEIPVSYDKFLGAA
jgi:type I restriction enzyme S subunit